VTLALRDRQVGTIVLDIEGTTTPIAFVTETLFPYARTHLREFLRDRMAAYGVRAAVDQLHAEWAADARSGQSPPGWRDGTAERRLESIAAYAEWLMDRDRKSPGLKSLQGQIWEIGYRSGALKGEVFPDVPPAFERWRGARLPIAIYSSGSALAQRLLFGSTAFGDLTPFISGFFDTSVGDKMSAASYTKIAEAVRQPAARTLFVSDVAREIEAARLAGWQIALCVREGNPPQTAWPDTPVVRTFDEIVT
jgi:enolase-phosphatase E1